MSSETKRRVEADEFVLRDANGSMRAALAMTLDGPGLFLYDQSGIIRARLLIGQDEPGLSLFDSLGRPRVSMCLVADEPTLRLQDAQGTSRAAIMVEDTGTRLMLSDANPGARVGIAAQSGEANLVFADPSGKPRIVLGNPGGVPGLTLLDVRGRRRAKLEIEEETSTFELYDSNGKTSSSRTVVWVEPRLQAADLEAKLALEATAHKQLEDALQSWEKRYTHPDCCRGPVSIDNQCRRGSHRGYRLVEVLYRPERGGNQRVRVGASSSSRGPRTGRGGLETSSGNA